MPCARPNGQSKTKRRSGFDSDGVDPESSGNPNGGCFQIQFHKSSIHWRKCRFAFFSFHRRCSEPKTIYSERTSMRPRVSSSLALSFRNSLARRNHFALFSSVVVHQGQALAPNLETPSNGIPPQSPGLGGTSCPGSTVVCIPTPTALRLVAYLRPQPRWGCWLRDTFPRVARSSQPWAE